MASELVGVGYRIVVVALEDAFDANRASSVSAGLKVT
jgi:hypothetical protein